MPSSAVVSTVSWVQSLSTFFNFVGVRWFLLLEPSWPLFLFAGATAADDDADGRDVLADADDADGRDVPADDDDTDGREPL